MGFKLHIPDVRLQIDNDALPGGLAAWGDGELEVVVDGSMSLGEFFEITERMAGVESAGDTAAGRNGVRDTLADFGGRIKSWSIEGLEPSAEGFMALPHLLALAIFAAWQTAAKPNPTSSGVSVNGSTSEAAYEATAAR